MPDGRRRRRVHQGRHRPEAQNAERHVDQPARPEDSLQRRDPEDEPGEERRGEEKDQEQAVSAAMAGNEIGYGPGKYEADQRRRQRAEDRAHQEGAISGFGEQGPVVVQIPIGIEFIALGAPEAEDEDRKQRQEEHQQNEENARTGKQEEERWAAPHVFKS